MFSGHQKPRPGLDEIGCLAVWLVGVLAAGWFGWRVVVMASDWDYAHAITFSGLALVGLPSFMFALAIARARPSKQPAWFLGTLVCLMVGSLLLMLLAPG
jgi:hypothetical protein